MKEKLLVLTSTFPRWKDDTIPPFVYELSKRLTSDFDVTVLAPNFPGAKNEEVMDGMKVFRFNYFIKNYQKLAGEGGILPTIKKNKLYLFEVPFFILNEYLALRKLVKKEKPDMIHAHWVIPQGIVAYWINKKYNVPYVITSHGSDILGLKGFKGLKKNILKNAYKITVVSNAIKKEVLETIDKNLKIEVIPMGVDTTLFNPNKKDISIKKKYDINGPFLLFVGRLAPEKGINYLVEVMPGVIKEYPDAKLMIIGDGTLREKLKEKVKELKIEKNIIFMDWIDNKELPKYYATADIFVCPSLREGSPVSYIESLACGTPLIVGDLPISREIIGKERGFVVKSTNPKDIKEKILKLIKQNKNKSFEKFIHNNYDWDVIKTKFGQVLK